jgi:tRNA A37 threonylcarbamoyladenosine synthetase subunit TsaC/SUA5/YrdC
VLREWLPDVATTSEILQQFGPKAGMITKIYDDGPRKSLASTVVRVAGDEVTVLREGSVSAEEIYSLLVA